MFNKTLKCGALALLLTNSAAVFIHALFNSHHTITTLMQNIGFTKEVLGVNEGAIVFICPVLFFGVVCPIALSLIYREKQKVILFMIYPIAVIADLMLVWRADPFGNGNNPLLFSVMGYALFMAIFCIRLLKEERSENRIA